MTAPSGPILFNSTGGSDTLASGLGPTDPVNGSGASVTNGSAVVTGIDTTGVSAGYLLWVNTSTGRQFNVIATVNSGTQVTCADNFGVTASGQTWAIGGKRASLAGSARLYANGGDLKAGWTIELESGYTESFSARLDFYGLGSTAAGPVILRGSSGAATKPVLTFTSTADLVPRNAYQTYRDFNLVRTSGTVVGIVATVAANQVFDGIGLDGFSTGVQLGSLGRQTVRRCRFVNCGAGLTAVVQNNKIVQCTFETITGKAIDANGALTGLEITGCIFNDIGGIACDINQTRVDQFGSVLIANNVFYDCNSDAIEYSGDHDSLGGLRIEANIFMNSGAFAIELSGIAANSANARGAEIVDNAFFNSTSGHRNVAVGEGNNDLTADPFVNAAAGDFNINNDAGGGAVLRGVTLTL